MAEKFYICEHCGNIVEKIVDSGVPVYCCGEPMKELIADVTDAAQEKHVPVYTVEDGIVKVQVGSTEHPMEDKHFIEWIALETKNGTQRKMLKPGEKPVAQFALIDGDEVESVNAYCNIHGLWKSAK